MLDYLILKNRDEKETIKDEFFAFFQSVYQQELSESSWQHQFISSPYNDTPLFIVKEAGKIVGSALMIRQKMKVKSEVLDYFLFTTSAIHEDHRAKGIYPELLKRQKEYAKNQKASFVFAFPNEVARPVLKLFGNFKNLHKIELGEVELKHLDLSNIQNSFFIDKNIMGWRFEHKKYQFVKYGEYVLVAKEFEDMLDMLAAYPKEGFDEFEVAYVEYSDDTRVLTNLEYVSKPYRTSCVVKNVLQPTYFAIDALDDSFEQGIVPINLLMSDVF